MKNITTHHTLNNITLYKRRYLMPENWQELPPKSFIRYSQLYTALFFSKQAYTPKIEANTRKLRLQLLPSLLQMSVLRIKRIPAFAIVQDKSLLSISEFLLNPEPVHTFYIKTINAKRKKLHSPDDHLAGTTFAEFVYADTYYLRYTDAPNPHDLNRFVAVLYRPTVSTHPEHPDYQGARQPFNQKTIDARAKRVARVPQQIKEAIAINYSFIRSGIISKYKNLFPKRNPDNPTQIQTNQNINTHSWVQIVSQIRPRWQPNDTILSLPYSDVLSDIDKQISENRKTTK